MHDPLIPQSEVVEPSLHRLIIKLKCFKHIIFFFLRKNKQKERKKMKYGRSIIMMIYGPT